MRVSTWIAAMLIVAGLGDGLASSAIALCRPAPSQTACCCGPQCSKDVAGPGMRSSCCDMQRAPLRGAETSATSRNTAPSAPTVLSAGFAAMIPLPASDAPTSVSLPGVPESLHAPPLYDLFRSYRI
jgi:hypothetical protein